MIRVKRSEKQDPDFEREMQEGKPNNLVEINIDNIIEQLLSVRGSKPGQLVNLSPEEIQFLYVSATDIIKTQPAFLELEAPIKIVGMLELSFIYWHEFIRLLI